MSWVLTVFHISHFNLVFIHFYIYAVQWIVAKTYLDWLWDSTLVFRSCLGWLLFIWLILKSFGITFNMRGTHQKCFSLYLIAFFTILYFCLWFGDSALKLFGLMFWTDYRVIWKKCSQSKWWTTKVVSQWVMSLKGIEAIVRLWRQRLFVMLCRHFIYNS